MNFSPHCASRPHRSYLILLSSPPFRLPFNVCQLVRLNSSISHFVLLLLLFVRNNVIYSFRRLPNTIRSPLRTASSRMFSSSSHLFMVCSSVTYLFPSFLLTFPLRSISSLILLLPTSLVSSVPDFLDTHFILCWGLHSAVIAFGAGHIICSLCVTMSAIRFAASVHNNGNGEFWWRMTI